MNEVFIKLSDAREEFYSAMADRDCVIQSYEEAWELLDGVERYQMVDGQLHAAEAGT